MPAAGAMNSTMAPAPTASLATPAANQGPIGNASNAYDIAMNRLNQSLKLGQNTTSGEMMQANQQLQQNQGRVQQGLINSGLGNTTVAQTMQQAPLQTYNQAIQNIQNAGAKNEQGVLGQQSQTALEAAAQMQNALQQTQNQDFSSQQQYQKMMGILPQVRQNGTGQ